MQRSLILTVLIVLLGTCIQAQNYAVAPGSQMKILGTSNLHDWETIATEVAGTAVIKSVDDGSLIIESAELVIPVASIKSDKGKKMDKLTYEALDAENFSEMTFSLKSATVHNENGAQVADISGLLTVKGVTKAVSFNATNPNNDGITWVGSMDMKMTDFEVSPPTALLGTLKTRDEITVEYNIRFQ